MPASQQPTIADRVAAAMGETTAWMTAEREKQRRRLRARPDQTWQEVASTIARERQRPTGAGSS